MRSGCSGVPELRRIAGLQAAIEQIAAGGAVGQQPRAGSREAVSIDQAWQEVYAKGCRRTMVWSRSGPVEMMSMGTPSKRLQPLEIAPGILGQLLVARHPDARSLPARAAPRTRPRSRRTVRESKGGVSTTVPSIL